MKTILAACLCLAVLAAANADCISYVKGSGGTDPCVGKQVITDPGTNTKYCCAGDNRPAGEMTIQDGKSVLQCTCYTPTEYCAQFPVYCN
ncbi:hypothetical protein PoB_005367700 [Plakobranchus ocellatus]|uniref:Uncharacterized protein n=1 Tax=Plakobranchus ocellatus TaxID=259542 RepID=A0AAV4C727_9GAST|nr:hypothetical protein PoB_005367700 [Plakobranchus ocellatus]